MFGERFVYHGVQFATGRISFDLPIPARVLIGHEPIAKQGEGLVVKLFNGTLNQANHTYEKRLYQQRARLGAL